MIRKEYGGYLPFEGTAGPDYFSPLGEKQVLRTNSAKTAIWFALRQMPVRTIYIPHYICSSVREMVLKSGYEVKPYLIDRNLLPEPESIEEDAGILIVNYFGIMEDAVRKAADRYRNVILDQSHAFFAEPLMREDVFNVYSCRKFFGVPDGGYLIGQSLKKPEPLPEEESVSEHFGYLVTSLEQGTNAAYREKQESDRYFYGRYLGMSQLTRIMLSTVDYAAVRRKRQENYRLLRELLGGCNRFTAETDALPAAYLYPFFGTPELKRRLVAEKIYVPTRCRELNSADFAGTREYALSDCISFLPVDQRYDSEDMAYLAGRVKKIMEETEPGGGI